MRLSTLDLAVLIIYFVAMGLGEVAFRPETWI